MRIVYRNLSVFKALLILNCIFTSLSPGQLNNPDSSTVIENDLSGTSQMRGFTSQRITSRQIKALPFRGLQSYLPILAGVVPHNGSLHVRGGRAGELMYFVNGISLTNRFSNEQAIPVIPEAIEQVELFTGAYSAEFGGGISGHVQTRMRTGGDTAQFSMRVETDHFARQGEQLLNTTVSGYRNIVGTVGGSLAAGMKFFLAAEHFFIHNRQSMFLEPFRFDNLVTDAYFYPVIPGTPLPGPVEFKRNYIDKNFNERNTLQGNFQVELTPTLHISVLGSYSSDQFPEIGSYSLFSTFRSPEKSGWPYVLQDYYRLDRNMINQTTTWLGSLQASLELASSTKLETTISLYDCFSHLYDPDFGDDWKSYTDSAKNARLGYTGWHGQYAGPWPYSTIANFMFRDPNAPNNIYRKQRQSSISATIDISSQILPEWKFAVGGQIESWTIRSYTVNNASYPYVSGIFSTEEEKRLVIMDRQQLYTYGYDYDGNQVEAGFDSPRKPRFTSLHIQNTLTFGDHTINVGARYETFDLHMQTFEDPYNAPLLQTGMYAGYYLDESKLGEQQKTSFFLPRMSFTSNIGNDLNLFISFGKYAQLPPLRELFISNLELKSRGYSSFYNNGLTFLLKPQLGTQLEVSLMKLWNRVNFIQVSGFQKRLWDQAELGLVDSSHGIESKLGLINKGEGTIRGIECIFVMPLNRRGTVKLQYAYTEATGTSSDSRSAIYVIQDFYSYYYQWPRPARPPLRPALTTSYDYNQAHRALVQLEYLFDNEDGQIVDGTRISVLGSFNSGHPYTKITGGFIYSPWYGGSASLANPGIGSLEDSRNSSATPWTYTIDVQMSRSFDLWGIRSELFVNVMNLLNTKNVVNVYPTTGDAQNDGWLAYPTAGYLKQNAGYEEFYRAINLPNRWGYMMAGGSDLFGSPRQIRVGFIVEM